MSRAHGEIGRPFTVDRLPRFSVHSTEYRTCAIGSNGRMTLSIGRRDLLSGLVLIELPVGSA